MVKFWQIILNNKNKVKGWTKEPANFLLINENACTLQVFQGTAQLARDRAR